MITAYYFYSFLYSACNLLKALKAKHLTSLHQRKNHSWEKWFLILMNPFHPLHALTWDPWYKTSQISKKLSLNKNLHQWKKSQILKRVLHMSSTKLFMGLANRMLTISIFFSTLIGHIFHQTRLRKNMMPMKITHKTQIHSKERHLLVQKKQKNMRMLSKSFRFLINLIKLKKNYNALLMEWTISSEI